MLQLYQGNSSWEAVFLGIPSIVVPQYKHQKIGKKIRKDGGCWKVKKYYLDYKELLKI